MKFYIFLIIAFARAENPEQENKIFKSFKCPHPGNFSHPGSCSSWIHCTEDLTPYELSCPVVPDIPDNGGRLFYDAERDLCDDPAMVICPPRGECEITCMQQGNCDCFDTCLPDNSSSTGGRWNLGTRCDPGLYWNPDVENGHGGSCDFWSNLSPEIQEIYMLDHTCVTPAIECYWEPDPNCDNKYFYLPHNSKHSSNLQHVSCPMSPTTGHQLYWEQKTKSCGFDCQHDPCITCA